MNNVFNELDLSQIERKGIDLETIEQQIEYFKSGFPPAPLIKPATVEHGIKIFTDIEINEFVDAYEEYLEDKTVLKFVPASGAASRMFKTLLSFYNLGLRNSEQKEELEKDKSFNSPWYFFEHIREFAFFDQLKNVLRENNIDIEEALNNHDYQSILKYFLTDEGMGYANLPKALLFFHSYDDEPRACLEEHIIEAALYASSSDQIARIHLTLSPEHVEPIKKLLNEVLFDYAEMLDVRFLIDHSIQEASTDTIAVNMENKPFRNRDGSLLFRPGGHGALINNLNKLDADIIFIKNIDNVVPDKLKQPTIVYKKLIGAYLIHLQEQVFEYTRQLDENDLTEGIIEEITDFLETELMLTPPPSFNNWEDGEKLEFLYEKLNRPIRVCGMVKNEGEPGGGPFWVKMDDDSESLQIVESSQIDSSDPVQIDILKNATHFNPVDLVCGIKNYKGENFDLKEFIDPKTGFISQKSKDGKDLKALELPGLWNGAMADWNTIFVEVPLVTFNPVKYINDLLREQHQ